MEEIRELQGHALRSRAFFYAYCHESLPKCGSGNVILQFVINHNRAKVKKVALGPGFVESARGNEPKSG